jgi:hypothetical protein
LQLALRHRLRRLGEVGAKMTGLGWFRRLLAPSQE